MCLDVGVLPETVVIVTIKQDGLDKHSRGAPRRDVGSTGNAGHGHVPDLGRRQMNMNSVSKPAFWFSFLFSTPPHTAHLTLPLPHAMRKKGTAKAAGSDKTPETVTTGDKRQLPLDFSRHGVHSKRVAPNHLDEDATKTTSDSQHRGTLSSTSTFSSTSDPPVIHVNLLASGTQTHTQSIDRTSHCAAETMSTIESSLLLGENHSVSRELFGEDDDDDALLISRVRRDYIDKDVDCEDDSSVSVMTEGELNHAGALSTKHAPMGDDDEKLDMILPPRFRWKTVYVAAFELALDTVLPDEAFLFTDEELALFETYRELPGTDERTDNARSCPFWYLERWIMCGKQQR